MRRLIPFLTALALVLPAPATSQAVGACPFAAGSLRAAYKEMLTVSSTALPFTASVWKPTNGNPPAVCAFVVVNTNSVSWWADGSTPTAASGIISTAAQSFSVGQSNMTTFKMIRVSSDAEVAIQYLTAIN